MSKRKRAVSHVRWGVALVATAAVVACSVRTEYVKRAFRPSAEVDLNNLARGELSRRQRRGGVLYNRTCLDAGHTAQILEREPEFTSIRNLNRLTSADFDRLFTRYEVACPPPNVAVIPSRRAYADQALSLLGHVKRENQGLFVDESRSLWEDVTSGWQDLWQELHLATLRRSDQVSAVTGFNEIGALSMSARNAPSDSAADSGFATLKERAQAAMIYVAGQPRAPKGKQKDSAGSAKELLESLMPSKDASFSPSQKVELTLSNALNSGSEADRMQYVAAYLAIPYLPGPPNGISLDREFARNYQANVSSLLGVLRRDPSWQRASAEHALSDMMVWVESVDFLATKDSVLNLGTLQTTASVSPSVGAPATSPSPATLSGTISGQRTLNISRDLDTRSTWISAERSMIRVTQRGVEEATIAGSIVTKITLHVPRTSLYVLKADDDTDTDTDTYKGIDDKAKFRWGSDRRCHTLKPLAVSLMDISEPLYSEIDGINAIVGTARISRPGGISNLWDIFQKEPDGMAFTRVTGPDVIPLWKNPRQIVYFVIGDLLSAELDPPRTCRQDEQSPTCVSVSTRDRELGVWQSSPELHQPAYALDEDSAEAFLSAIKDRHLGLEATGASGWYSIVDCATWSYNPRRASLSQRIAPLGDEVWLGQESDDGLSEPFASATVLNLQQLRCPQQMSPCPTPTATRTATATPTPSTTPTP